MSTVAMVSGTHAPDFDSIIFDLDGTLWDACEACAQGWNEALDACGVHHVRVTADQIRGVCGVPFGRCVDILLGESAGLDAQHLHRLIDAHERRRVETAGGLIFRGVAGGLSALAQRYRLFLVSNCQSWYLRAFLAQSGFEHCFGDQDCHGDSGLPKAQMIERMVVRNGLERPIYIGDTVGDEQASRAAGVAFGHAGYGFGAADAPDCRFESFGAMVSAFGLEAAT